MAKSVGYDPNDVKVTAEAGIGRGFGERSYVLNYNVVRTKDGKELFKVINMISVEEDSHCSDSLFKGRERPSHTFW